MSISRDQEDLKARESLPGGSKNIVMKYITACLLFALTLTIGALFSESNYLDRIPYQVMIFLLCSWPFFLTGNKPRHRLLAIFMACYYLIFGMSNFFDIILNLSDQFIMGSNPFLNTRDAGMARSDWVVVLGAVFFIFGYYLVSRAYGNRQSRILVRDWNPLALLAMGLTFWIVGFTVSLAYDMVVSPMHIPKEILGLPLGIASNMRLFTPLGGLMLVYLAVSGYRQGVVWPLLVLIMVTEFCFGFIVNAKEASFRLPALLVLGQYYMRGTINKKVIVIALLVFIPYLLYFNIYRGQILQERKQSQMQAIHSLEKNADVLLKEASKQKNVVEESLGGLKKRFDGKVYIDIIVNGTDSGRVPFLSGKTLMYFFYGLIPRMVWQNKPDLSTGQMFNWAFRLSESRYTFVPTTQLGELYWNYGMAGVVAGMACIGMVFGTLACLLSSGEGMTIVRFMLLLLATYFLALRFEVNIGLQYPTFLKLVFFLALAHKAIGLFGLYRRASAPGMSFYPVTS